MSKRKKNRTKPPGTPIQTPPAGPFDQLEGLSARTFILLSVGCVLLAMVTRWAQILETIQATSTLFLKGMILGFLVALCTSLSCTAAHVYSVLHLKTAPKYIAAIWGAWFLICFKAILEWPFAVFPINSPIHTWYGFLSVFGLPALVWSTKASTWPQGQRYCGLFVKILLPLGLWSTLAYLTAVYPDVEGSDFWFYLCNARDVLLGSGDTAIARYVYFPGVYTFWKVVLRFFGGSVFSVQVAYVLLQLANYIAVGLLIGILTRHLWLAIWSSLVFAVISSRYEGFEGLTEPLSTLPILIGMILWRGRPLRQPASYISLGLAFALAVYFKQQGGLLTIAYLSIVYSEWIRGKWEKPDWLAVIGIPIISVCCFLLLVLMEGNGLKPITLGLGLADQYAQESSWWENTIYFRDRNWPVGIGILCLIAGYLTITSRKETRQWLKEPAGCVFGYSLGAVLLSLLQYSWRPYQHYFLLGAPFLAVGLALLGYYCWANLSREAADFPVTRLLVIALAGTMTLVPEPLPGDLHLWSLRKYPGQPPWLASPKTLQSVNTLIPHIHRGEVAVFLPLGQNEIHFILGTRSTLKAGYRWPHDGLKNVDWLQTDVVLVFKRGRPGPIDQRWETLNCDAAFNEMLAAGFKPMVETEVMTLYRK